MEKFEPEIHFQAAFGGAEKIKLYAKGSLKSQFSRFRLPVGYWEDVWTSKKPSSKAIVLANLLLGFRLANNQHDTWRRVCGGWHRRGGRGVAADSLVGLAVAALAKTKGQTRVS